MQISEQFFYVDNLSLIMMALNAFVAISVASFSSRYLKGDRRQFSFYLNLVILVSAVFVTVSADNILLLIASWTVGNIFLTRLMLHKREWEAAWQSALLALKNFTLGVFFLGSALLLLYTVTGETSIQAILNKRIGMTTIVCASLLILLTAMTQSALWPFHRWLTSSLNSPTPVSAIMHAGLVNGGGFLLARFAPMLSDQPVVLDVIFTAGVVTALVGILWKLMQSDVKRMLACSTMGQMGFMIAQCGLGLFPAAVAHLCWHGLFKAYLFLASGSSAQERRLDLGYPPSIKHFSLALMCGVLGAGVFSFTSGKDLSVGYTTWFLIWLAIIAGTQFALPIIRSYSLAKNPMFLITITSTATACLGALYGFSIRLMERELAVLNISNPQPLNALHLFALLVMTTSWLVMLFVRREKSYPDWVLKAYVRILNASQPHPKTVTAHRNHYQY